MSIAISLLQGMETNETFNSVLEASRVRSQPLINALHYHYVDGAEPPSAYKAYGVHQQVFARGVNAMNKAYRKLESDVIDNNSKASA